ncbi:hypothetical protein CspHIS471_0503090 [Cutaneotrichosporon sp. HIS471]|nr:hypothetical protein CspHIS471_0503090 [Cutaneotrichosporon sp. HIS471]
MIDTGARSHRLPYPGPTVPHSYLIPTWWRLAGLVRTGRPKRRIQPTCAQHINIGTSAPRHLRQTRQVYR